MLPNYVIINFTQLQDLKTLSHVSIKRLLKGLSTWSGKRTLFI